MVDVNDSQVQVISLTIRPYPPDTVDNIRSELKPMVESALREHGKEDLLAQGQIKVHIEETLPLDPMVVNAIITIATGVVTGITVETFKEIVIPKLKKRFGIEENNTSSEKKHSNTAHL